MNAVEPLPQAAFLKRRRSSLLGFPAYQDIAGDAKETFEIVGSSLADPERVRALSPNKPMVASRRRAWDANTCLHIQYTAGLDTSLMRDFFPEAVSYWTTYAAFDRAFDDGPGARGRRVPHIDLHDVDYWHAIRLTSFAILLGHTDLLPRIAALWDYENDDMDGLLERLVAPFVPGRAPPPDTCTRHLPYFKLLKVFAADPAKRPALMARYMDEWYTASRREPYYESHVKGREHSFLGHWSFEAAAVVYVLDIDDSTFRDHEFYPRDLADFARSSLPRPVALGGAPGGSSDGVILRCPAGQACPRAGYWFTPARLGSRRVFQQGEVMPDVGGDYGATIWQWDDQQ